jgi:hypothetical protein
MECCWTGRKAADQRGKGGFGSDFGMDGGDSSDFSADPWLVDRLAPRVCESDFFRDGEFDLNKKKVLFKYFFKNEQGNAIMTGLYTILIIMICFCVGIDIAGYGSMAWKLRNACAETLALIKIENGFDDGLNLKFQEFLTAQGMDPAQVEAEGTPKLVQRGDLVEIHAETAYTLRALRPLGRQLKAPVQVTLRGLAQDYIRR